MCTHDEMREILARSGMFRKHERVFAEAPGFPLTLRPMNARRLPLLGKRRENSFCALMTGTNQTCAVRLRAQEEGARDSLLNLNLSVGEIAFEVGFRSPTHFSRVFKTVAGMPSSGFCRKLPQIVAAPQEPVGPRNRQPQIPRVTESKTG